MKKSNIKESVTLKINEKINTLRESGKKVYNLTSGQLNFRPPVDLIRCIEKELNFLKSFQYSPNKGFKELRRKFSNDFKSKRNITLSQATHSCIISSGSKFSLNLAIGALVQKASDEVVLVAPYWGSYPEIVKIWGGKVKCVNSFAFNSYIPKIEDIRNVVGPNTRAIIINSPNNPVGIHYDQSWMKEFALFLKEHPNLYVISDEIYSDLCYYDPKPSYFYEFDNELLERTIVINGISKSLASTGLRIGYAIANKDIVQDMVSLQSQLASGPNSLIQNALINFDLTSTTDFLDTIKKSIRNCSSILRDAIVNNNMSHTWYQTGSGFYYFMDFTKFRFFSKYESSKKDYSEEICEEILEQTGVALVPGSYFGMANSARLSMTLEEASFKEAVDLLMVYLMDK